MDEREHTVASSIERAQRRREQAPRPLSELCGDCLESIDRGCAAGSTWSAGRAWHAVNGDIERAHTTGLYVREPRGHETLPTLLVYVDSRARATDFSANREVYLARLANAGLRFADISFRVSKRPARRETPAPAHPGKVAESAPTLPLTDDESRRVDEMTRALPENLKEPVRRAMSAVLRAEKADEETDS